MRKTNFLPGVLGLLAAVPWCPAAAPEPLPAAQYTYIYANSHLWRARPVRKDVSIPASSGMLQRTVTLSMRKVPVGEVIRYVCMGTGLQYRFEKDGIFILDRSGCLEDLMFQVFTVTPAFALAVGSEPSAAKLKQYWEALGIHFPSDFKVRYVHDRRLLFLRHTPSYLNKMEQELRSRGMFESKAYNTYGLPPPLPLAEVSYRDKLYLIIPFIEWEEVPVGKVLLDLVSKAKAVDPKHEGINLLLYYQETEPPFTLGQEECQQYLGTLPVSADPNMPPNK